MDPIGNRKKEADEFAAKMRELIANICTTNIMRQRQSGDPVLRASLFIDKIATIFDIAFEMGTHDPNIDNDESSQLKYNKAKHLINEEFIFLLEWVRSPLYSPDHPYGNRMMTNAEQDFKNLTKKSP